MCSSLLNAWAFQGGTLGELRHLTPTSAIAAQEECCICRAVMKMKLQRRFHMRMEPDWTWSVIDVFTGNPVLIAKEPQIGLMQKVAFARTVELNAMEGDRIKLDAKDH